MPGSSPPPWIRRLAPGRPEFVAELLPYWRQTGHYSTQLSRYVTRRRSPTKRPSVKEGLWVNVILALVRLRQSCSHARTTGMGNAVAITQIIFPALLDRMRR